MQIYKYRKVTSTQDLAKKYLANKAQEIAAFIAQEQTAGYGKRGRSFYSPAKTGIYLSIALPNFKFKLEHAGLLMIAIGVAVVHILQEQFPSYEFRLKWVNDIYLNDKKVAGILTEKIGLGLVIGIGVNIFTASFPKNISNHVGSIVQADYAFENMNEQLIRAVVQAANTYQNNKFLDEYRKISYLKSKVITLKINHHYVTGRVVTIDDQGRLVISCRNSTRCYSSGEVIKVELEPGFKGKQ